VLEVRKCDSGLIHVRFILTRTHGWNFGSSLKDFGKKLTMIKELLDHAKREAETYLISYGENQLIY